MSIRIVTDSTCDLPEMAINEHNIEVIPLLITQGDHTFRDGVDLKREDFYSQLPEYNPAPTTGAPSQ